MNPISLTFQLTIDESNIRAIINAIRQAFHVDSEFDERADARMKSSRNATLTEHKPPEDRGLLIDVNQVAKLLKVSPRGGAWHTFGGFTVGLSSSDRDRIYLSYEGGVIGFRFASVVAEPDALTPATFAGFALSVLWKRQPRREHSSNCELVTAITATQ